MLCDCVREVAHFCALELDRIPPVESVESEVLHELRVASDSP